MNNETQQPDDAVPKVPLGYKRTEIGVIPVARLSR